jgi:hypothetical protein
LKKLEKIVIAVAMYIIASIFATATLLIYAFPFHPKSLPGWLFIFIVALPIIVLAELPGEKFWTNPITNKIEKLTSRQAFSWTRIFLYVLLILLVCGIAYGISMFFFGWTGLEP